MTYDPTGGIVYKEASDSTYLLPLDVEGISIDGEGLFPYYFGESKFCCKDGEWYRKTAFGYYIPVNGVSFYNSYSSLGFGCSYSQASSSSISYVIEYDENGNWSVKSGLVHNKILLDGQNYDAYSYYLPNGRKLVNIEMTIDGVTYVFDKQGACLIPITE